MNTKDFDEIAKTCRFLRGTLIFFIFALFAIAFLVAGESLQTAVFYAAAAAALTVVFIKMLLNC